MNKYFMDLVEVGNITQIEEFIKGSSDRGYLNARDSFGNTPLIKAASTGNIEVVNVLLKTGADPKFIKKSQYDALGIAVFNQNFQVADLLLANGASVDTVFGDYDSLLLAIAAYGKIASLNWLLNNNALPEKNFEQKLINEFRKGYLGHNDHKKPVRIELDIEDRKKIFELLGFRYSSEIDRR